MLLGLVASILGVEKKGINHVFQISQYKDLHYNVDHVIRMSSSPYDVGHINIMWAQKVRHFKGEKVRLKIYLESGRWQAPAAVLPPEGWQRGRGPEGPEDKGHGHSRARRAREWPKHASPRARRARGRAKLSARLGACQCHYMFFHNSAQNREIHGPFSRPGGANSKKVKKSLSRYREF